MLIDLDPLEVFAPFPKDCLREFTFRNKLGYDAVWIARRLTLSETLQWQTYRRLSLQGALSENRAWGAKKSLELLKGTILKCYYLYRELPANAFFDALSHDELTTVETMLMEWNGLTPESQKKIDEMLKEIKGFARLAAQGTVLSCPDYVKQVFFYYNAVANLNLSLPPLADQNIYLVSAFQVIKEAETELIHEATEERRRPLISDKAQVEILKERAMDEVKRLLSVIDQKVKEVMDEDDNQDFAGSLENQD